MCNSRSIVYALIASCIAHSCQGFQSHSTFGSRTVSSSIIPAAIKFPSVVATASVDDIESDDQVSKLLMQAGKEAQKAAIGEEGEAAWWKNPTNYMAAGSLALGTALALGGQPAWASSGAAAITAETSSWWTSIAETGFYQAFSLVFVSEIGDKTFFIAGLLAMKTSKLVSFLGSIGALAVMTVISVVIGQLFHAVPSGFADGIPLDDIAAVLAFTFFGLKTLKEALAMEEGESVMDEELAEAEKDVDESTAIKEVTKFGQLASIFGLVFAAEFGDRSFLSTIALSAAQNPFSVCAGGIAAHAVATGIAVSGGSYIAKYISEKVIGVIGGVLFLVFAVTTAFGIF
mmetsp:Transcript_9855/g.13011  ORF Transcript_9855/g.13011 Transcript_9855/m.13011 type:complete len:345 (-) Transcript_9855:99-1133(-)|eukprot:CAMPEP_0198136590 /NCGR_PEP_ID=MMETSP1443-20131203/229_1 /TAXON_ID=186043 /ORGANISM="Entomoneis sp., Strain CCMP2396" /LENGTH=344 /DNA_ID=CAMNT_0043797837 /DNA_START=95 /DNA_END=1129 /DNA_ORIENTATION=-